MQLTLSMVITRVTTSVAIMQVLRWYFLILVYWWIFLLQLCSKRFLQHICRWQFNFYFSMQMGVSVAIMQVVFSAVHCTLDCFYCNYASDSFFYSYVGDSFIWQFRIPFSNCQPLFIKLAREHWKTLYKVCISSLL